MKGPHYPCTPSFMECSLFTCPSPSMEVPLLTPQWRVPIPFLPPSCMEGLLSHSCFLLGGSPLPLSSRLHEESPLLPGFSHPWEVPFFPILNLPWRVPSFPCRLLNGGFRSPTLPPPGIVPSPPDPTPSMEGPHYPCLPSSMKSPLSSLSSPLHRGGMEGEWKPSM